MLPFASQKANRVEAGLLASLMSITVLSGPDLTWERAVAIETIFFVTTALVVGHMIWFDGNLKKRLKPPQPEPGYRVPGLDEEDDGTMLRDPLLADPVPSIHDQSTSF